MQALLGQPHDDAGTPAPAKPSAIAWARVSTSMQEDRGLSIPEQLREIRAYAERHGIQIVAEFHEAASAFQRDEKRLEFHRMLAQAKSDPSISLILVHDLSRFSRDSARAKVMVRELLRAGTKVVSLNDPEIDPESVTGVYMEAITYAKNEAYSREIAFHTRKGCRANVQARDPETGWCYKNGGQPLWGYRAERLPRGKEKGRTAYKSIWVFDDTVVAGRSTHEWVRECLILAAGGATLDQLRDFCNNSDIPARRGQFWGISTWNSLLQPSALLQYCGYGVWNVHQKNGRERPASEWVVVENAHPALITQDEAKAIAATRRRHTVARRFDGGYGKSRASRYLLSGGLFKCGRCGKNMIGFRSATGSYYVCGSQPYRRGLGCGPSVLVQQDWIERDVVNGLGEILGRCTDPKGPARRLNEELRHHWEVVTGRDPDADRKLAAIDAKVANIRRAVEDGLSDAAWANARLQELHVERAAILGSDGDPGCPPQVDPDAALALRRETEQIMTQGPPAARKQALRAFVEEITLAPENLEV